MYLLPFFTYTNPDTAKALLTYRATILPQAQKRAQELSQDGALFAWRTIDVKKRVPIILPEPHNCISMPISFMLFNSMNGSQEMSALLKKSAVKSFSKRQNFG